MSKRPRFKIGDTVRIRPYNDFKSHTGIPKNYWIDLWREVEVLDIDEPDDTPGSVYYTFRGVMFSWHERYIHQSDFLTDKDFDI